MLVAYLDESGTHRNSEIVSISGLLHGSVKWSRLEKPWEKNLNVLGISWFHATDCENGTGEFFGKDRPLRESLRNGLADAILDLEPVLVASVVTRGDWDAIATPAFKDRYIDPYHFCFEHCLQQISKSLASNDPGKTVAFVFATQKEYQSRASLIHEKYSVSEMYPCIGSVTYRDPRCLVQLQAADLFAYEVYRESGERLKSQRKPERDVFRKFREQAKSIGEFYDQESFAANVKNFESRSS